MVMPQSHHNPGPVRAVPRLFWTKIVRPLRGPAQAPCVAVRILPPRTGPVEFYCMHYKLTDPYGFWDCEQPVRGPYGPRTTKYDARTGFLPIMVVSIPLRVRKGAVRHPCGSRTGPYGSRRIWKILKIPVRGPYDARTGIAWGTRGILRIIQPNHKCADVSSRTGPVAWCDHGNSTDVTFVRALHLALRARNRTGDKNRTGPVVACDWGIKYCISGLT